MGTKTVTLTPDYINGVAASRVTYPLDVYMNKAVFAYRLPFVRSIKAINLSYSFTAVADQVYDDSLYVEGTLDVYTSNSVNGSSIGYRIGQKTKAGTVSSYSSANVSDSLAVSESVSILHTYLIVSVQSREYGSASGFGSYMSNAPTLRVSVEYTDISIEPPGTVQTTIGKTTKATIKIFDIFGVSRASLALSANNKTFYTDTFTPKEPVGSMSDGYFEEYTEYDLYCDTDWFKTIASKDDTITVTIKITDNSKWQRTATGTFEIKKPPLSIEASESNVVMSADDYEENLVDVDGEYSGKFTITVKHGNTTEESYQIDAAAEFDVRVEKNWFYNQSFTSTNITVTLQDELYRVRQATFSASLPTLEISLDRSSYDTDDNNTIDVTVTGSVGSANISYKIGSGSWNDAAGSSISLSPSIFAETKSNQLSVTIKAETEHYKQSGQQSTTVAAGANVYPQISYMAVINVPDTRMPSEYASDYVQGYSKVGVSVQYTKGAANISDPPDLKLTGLGEAVTLTKDGDYYKATTASVVMRETTLTVTVTDTMGRRGQQTYTIKESDIVKLQTITITPQSTSVEAGEDAVFEVTGFVGSYDISFVDQSKKTLTGGDTGQTSQNYTQEAKSSWFTEAGETGKRLTVTVVVTDILERSKDLRFTVALPEFKLEFDSANVLIDTDLNITIKGAAGQTVSMVFTTPKDDETIELYSVTASGTSKIVRCPQSWFTGFDAVASLPITISATTETQETAAQFSLNYPALGLAVTKTVESEEVAVTSATVGENLNYTFSNLAGEEVNVNYIYTAQNNKLLLQYGPYSTAQTIATPQLFDLASPPVTKSPSMRVDIVISDARQRKATVNNFTINVNDSMRPSVFSADYSAKNPQTVDSSFETYYIGGVTKLIAVIKASSGSMAGVTEAILSIDGANVTMTPDGVDSDGKYVFKYAGDSPLQVDAIYEPRSVNLTMEYGLNNDGELISNPKRAATVNPISVRKDSTYTVTFSNPNDQYRVQCALWEGDVFDEVITSESNYSEVSFDTGDCDTVYVSLMRATETSETDPVDVGEAGLTIRLNVPSGMYAQLTPITLDVTVKDERGLSNDNRLVNIIYAYPYNAPHASIGYHRCLSNRTPNDSGDNCLLTCDFAFEGLWINAFPTSPQNQGYVTVSTTNYEETKQFDFTKWEKAQFTLEAGYGFDSNWEVVSNPLRAATVIPIEVTGLGIARYKVTLSGGYLLDYAEWNDNTLYRQGTASNGEWITVNVNSDLYISLKRSEETSGSAPVDIAEANVQLAQNSGNSEDGSFEFLIPNMSIEQTYQIAVTLTDLITSTAYTVTLSTGGAIMDFYRGGKGVAIGKVAEDENLLEVNPNWELRASVKINGQLYDLATLLSQIKQQLGI